MKSTLILTFSLQDSSNNVTNRLLRFRRAIIEELDHMCPSCGLSIVNIKDDEFSCHGLTDHIIYRAMIIGTDTYSAPNLVSLIQSWVASGSASITIFSSRLRVDKDCTTFLDTFRDPDCPFIVSSEPQLVTTVTVTASKPMVNVAPSASPHRASAGEIGGFLIGSIIIVLLIVLIAVIVVVALRKYKYKIFKR